MLPAELKTYCGCKYHIYSLNHDDSLKNHSISQTTKCGHLFCLVISELLGARVMLSPVFSNNKRLEHIKSTHEIA